MHPLVELILRVCREHGIHPNEMTRDRMRQLSKDPIPGLKNGAKNFIGWKEAMRRAFVVMHDDRDETDPRIPAIPSGHTLEKTTLKTTNNLGETVYLKTKIDNEARAKEESLRELARSLVDMVHPRDWQIEPPKDVGNPDVMNLHALGDPHFGMRADGEETGGASWGLADAVRVHDAAISKSLTEGIHARTGMLCYFGDNTHADNSFNTTTKGTVLDVDATHKASVEAFKNHVIRSADKALTVYEKLYIRIVSGNHDWNTSWLTSLMFEAHYRNEPRVEVLVTKEPAHAFEFGNSAIITNHGDKLPRKMDALEKWCGERWPALWGTSLFRYILEGHVHHTKTKKLSNRRDEISHGEGRSYLRTFPTLAPSDMWHSDKYVPTQITHKLSFSKSNGLFNDRLFTARELMGEAA